MGPILIDDRSGSKELAQYISPPHEISRLNSGDFAIFGNGPEGMVTVGVERKTLPDLIQSIESGRLSGHQLISLMSDYQYVYILVEGLWRPRPKDGVLERWSNQGKWTPFISGSRRYMARDIANYLNTLAVCCGVMVWRTDNMPHSGRWISDLHGWWQKPWDRHKAHLNKFNVTPPPRAFLRRPGLLHRFVKELDGVGWDKGKAIAQHFGSLSALLFATEKELMEVPGIGKVLAQTIHKQILSLQ